MKKILIRLMCCIIPSRQMRRRFRHYMNSPKKRRGKTYDRGKNNIIIIIDKDGKRRRVQTVPNSVITFSGSNNYLELYEPTDVLELDVEAANNLHLVVEPGSWRLRLKIQQQGTSNGMPGKGNLLHIGRGCSTSDWMSVNLVDDGGDVIIGKDCQISWNCDIRTGDHHTILDCDTNEIVNHSKDVVIGDHVWLGSDVCLLKGAGIPDHCVVGMRSLVTRKFTDQNCVIAGSPAHVVRRGIDWDRKSIMTYKSEK